MKLMKVCNKFHVILNIKKNFFDLLCENNYNISVGIFHFFLHFIMKNPFFYWVDKIN